MIDFKQKLAEREARHLYRRRHTSDGPQGPLQQIDGREYLSFCSNDYLGLANHPEVVAAFKRGADSYGVGSGAAHLVNGHSRAHHALEEELAAFTNRPRALLFSTGYMANLGVVAALAGAGDAVFEDRLNHASLLDAALLSRARLARYDHLDSIALQTKLATSKAAQKLVLTDGVFSMDGDIAPLPELATVARQHDALLMVDDAHGLGVLGPQGRGSCARFGLGMDEVPILMATLGKGLGSFGAFVAGSDDLIEWLIQAARPYIYTTATPPALAEASRASLRLVQREEWRRERLQALIQRFRCGAAQLGLGLMPSETPIQPLLLGDAGRAVALSRRLEAQGILISAIRPPTVPDGTARLRITLSAAHTEGQVDRLLAALEAMQP
jgi:8-amino-7-oxononanoate synthase